MPCLNEEASVGLCVTRALEVFAANGWRGEVIVVDNGSTDRSVEFAEQHGAMVIHEKERGYGSACLAGLKAARGGILLIGDSDASYDFAEIPKLVAPLTNGTDLVLGSRFQGQIAPGAMPLQNRLVGNPMLTFMLNV